MAGKGYMGRKDIVDRPYFSDRERFAELVNAALYHGDKILRSGDLVPQCRKYPALSNAYSEMERDIWMIDRRQNICYGIEIETESDYRMPQRVMTYDACEYEYQIREIDRGHRERESYQNYRDSGSLFERGTLGGREETIPDVSNSNGIRKATGRQSARL